MASLFERYKQIDPTERCYISHFHLLADAMAACGVENDLEESTVVSGNAGDREEAPLLFFSEADKAETDALPSPLSTEQYVAVVKLLDKCEQSDDFEGKEAYLEKLRAAKAEIDALQAEIDAINADVLENLYPFENISLKDKGTVDEIVARYERLSDYDKQKIQRAEDILKAKIQVDNLARAVWIAAAIGVAAVIIAVVTVLRIRSRRRKKRLFKEMPVEDEEDDA